MSFRVADALAIVGYPIIHVTAAIPPPARTVHGQSPADDPEIAKWCAQTEYVLVTADSDFKMRWVRSGLLAQHGVEVIVFEREIAGLQEQHFAITRHIDAWLSDLGKQPYGHRVWNQSRGRIHPSLRVGKKLPPRSRAASAPIDSSRPGAPHPE